jgi:8-oxo-dGTP pyrophosphatase MutT (NUDIX family)
MRRYSAAELVHAPGPRPDGSPEDRSPWRRDARETRFGNPWFVVYEDRAWNARAGRHFDYGTVSFRNRAVGILALEPDGRIWLVGQHRYPLDEFSWELPMGGVPVDECLLDGARRELKEETGLEAEGWELLLERVHLSNSVTDEVGTIFLATGLTAGPMAAEDNEELWVIRLPLAEAVEAVLDGRITDSLTVAGVLAMAARAGASGGTLP